jgi:hypothetical protein
MAHSNRCEIGRLGASEGAPDNGEERESKRRWRGTGVALESSEDGGGRLDLRRAIPQRPGGDLEGKQRAGITSCSDR